MRYYILQNREPVPVETDLQWMLWWGRVSLEEVLVASERIDRAEFTTEFVGRHSRGPAEKPALIFETVRCRGKHSVVVRHYASWEEATRGHQEVVSQATREKRGQKDARVAETGDDEEGSRGRPAQGIIHRQRLYTR